MTGTSRGKGRPQTKCAQRPRSLASSACTAAFFLILALACMPHAVRADGLTNGRVIAASDTGAVTTERAAIARAVNELSGSAAACASGMPAKECAVAELRAFVDGLQPLGTADQLAAVNSYVNRARYVSDADNYGWRDYWASPSALLTRGGDCEDYVLAKYAALRLLGIPDSAMRIFVAHHKPRRIAHAVLAVDVGGATYVLDNESDDMSSISGTHHLKPLYALNETGYWLYVQI